MNKKSKLAVKGGSYSIIITAIVLAILVVVNICVSALPSNLTKLDISSSKLYSVTSNTKAVVNALEQDVNIYWIVQADEEDDVIENLLSKYDSLSDHLNVIKKNPDVYPTFAQQYTDENVMNNSLVVESGDRYRFISYDDIYLSESNIYSYSYSTSFDGEGAVTSAINYVTTEDLPKAYVITGHGEADLPDSFKSSIERENIEIDEISLLTTDEIPEDSAFLIIYSPSSDISEDEKYALIRYVTSGGKLLVIAGPTEDCDFENLYRVLSAYGINTNEGIIIEGDRDHYAFQYPYILIPDLQESDITDPLSEEGYTPIVPLATGLTVVGDESSVTTILLKTSVSSYSKKAGFALETYEKEDGDISGPFAVGVSVVTKNDGEIVWFTSSAFLDDMYNAYSSGANVDLVMNAITELVGDRDTISIRSKSLNYEYLTITDSQGAFLKMFMIGIIPVTYLAIGIYMVISSRKEQNEKE